jgi:hypothetical protein
MPIYTLVGVVAVFVAFVLYTVGVWGMFRAKAARPRDLIVLWTALAVDVFATVMMGMVSGGLDFSTPANSAHTVVALAAFAAMLVFVALATRARTGGREAMSRALAKWIVAPWVLWVAVFAWGLVTRMPRR